MQQSGFHDRMSQGNRGWFRGSLSHMNWWRRGLPAKQATNRIALYRELPYNAKREAIYIPRTAIQTKDSGSGKTPEISQSEIMGLWRTYLRTYRIVLEWANYSTGLRPFPTARLQTGMDKDFFPRRRTKKKQSIKDNKEKAGTPCDGAASGSGSLAGDNRQ